MESHEPNRQRTRNLVIRLNDYEREALERAAERRGMSISGVVRFLVRQDEDKAAERAARTA
jgi:uncharacterized protein (DUF1778 family)